MNLEVGEAGGLGVFCPPLPPKRIWRVVQGGKALGSPSPRDTKMKALWFKFKEECSIVEWI